VIHSNFLSGMHGFRDNEVLLQAGYDVIMISWWALQAIFHDGFLKSDHDFLIAFHSIFFICDACVRDNKVLFQTVYNVIVISPPGGRFRRFFIADSERATMTS